MQEKRDWPVRRSRCRAVSNQRLSPNVSSSRLTVKKFHRLGNGNATTCHLVQIRPRYQGGRGSPQLGSRSGQYTRCSNIGTISLFGRSFSGEMSILRNAIRSSSSVWPVGHPPLRQTEAGKFRHLLAESLLVPLGSPPVFRVFAPQVVDRSYFSEVNLQNKREMRSPYL